jgi:hypothetical protein
MLYNILAEKIVVYKKEKGAIIGCGYGVIEQGFVGIFDIIVKEDMRGRGYGGRDSPFSAFGCKKRRSCQGVFAGCKHQYCGEKALRKTGLYRTLYLPAPEKKHVWRITRKELPQREFFDTPQS